MQTTCMKAVYSGRHFPLHGPFYLRLLPIPLLQPDDTTAASIVEAHPAIPRPHPAIPWIARFRLGRSFELAGMWQQSS